MEHQEEKSRDLTDEVRRVVDIVEEITGLRSRWNGTVHVLDAQSAVLFSGKPFFARKD